MAKNRRRFPKGSDDLGATMSGNMQRVRGDISEIQEQLDAGKPTNTTAMNDARRAALCDKLGKKIASIADQATRDAFNILRQLQGV